MLIQWIFDEMRTVRCTVVHDAGPDGGAVPSDLHGEGAAPPTGAARPGLRFSVRANRAFLARVVRLLAGELAIRQFLDIGTGIPNTGVPSLEMVHEVAQAVAPESRVVYVDNDPWCWPTRTSCGQAAQRAPPTTSR